MLLVINDTDKIEVSSFTSTLTTRELKQYSSFNFPASAYTKTNVDMLHRYLRETDDVYKFDIVAQMADGTEEIIQTFHTGGFLEIEYSLVQDKSGMVVPVFTASFNELAGFVEE